MNTQFIRGRTARYFPIWILYSGLPQQLSESTKGNAAFLILRELIERDLECNPSQPSTVEVSLSELSVTTGVAPEKQEKAIKALRKQGLVRCFLPDTVEEPALFQIITPLPLPESIESLRARLPQLEFNEWPPRYSVGTDSASGEAQENRARQVIDLYLNTFSMKLNSLIVDQLKVIADRYDADLIKKVFMRARDKNQSSLSSILSEITREDSFRRKAAQEKPSDPGKPPL